MRKASKKFFQSWQASRQVYSLLGGVAILITVGFLFYFYFQLQVFFATYDQLKAGVFTKNSLPTSDQGVLFTSLMLLSFAYLTYMTLLVQYARYKLNKKAFFIDKKSVKGQVRLCFHDKPFLGPFFLEVQVELRNVTAESHIPSIYKLSGYLHDKEVSFSAENLPTGKYEVKLINFFFRDPLQLFKTRSLFFDEEKRELCVAHPKSSHNFELAFQLQEKDSIKTIYTRQGSEEYFSTREYAPGDELKKIHWKNTAKNSKLMIKVPEAKPFDNSEVGMVINCFAPYYKQLNQAEVAGEFLDSILEFVDFFVTKYPGRPFQILCNSRDVIKIDKAHQFSPEALTQKIIESALFQDSRAFSQIKEDKNIEETMLFTLSSDWIDPKKNYPKLLPFVYLLSESPLLKRKRGVVVALTARISLGSVINPLYWMRRVQQKYSVRKLREKIAVNEPRYLKDEHVILLNA